MLCWGAGKGKGGRGWERGFFSLFACLSFVSALLCRLPALSFASCTLSGGAASLPSVCKGLALLLLSGEPAVPLGRCWGLAESTTEHWWEGAEAQGGMGFEGGKERAEVPSPQEKGSLQTDVGQTPAGTGELLG